MRRFFLALGVDFGGTLALLAVIALLTALGTTLTWPVFGWLALGFILMDMVLAGYRAR
jgi:hypothetical protein